MKLGSLIHSLNPKVAEAAPSAEKPPVAQPVAEKTAGAASALDDAIRETLRAIPGATKTASESAGQPESDLEKMAAQARAADRDGELKHAHLVGQTMAHGFLATLDQYGAAANALNSKVAAEQVTPEALELAKLAMENPVEFLNQVKQGADYARLHDQAVVGVHKLACDHYLGGYSAMAQVLDS